MEVQIHWAEHHLIGKEMLWSSLFAQCGAMVSFKKHGLTDNKELVTCRKCKELIRRESNVIE